MTNMDRSPVLAEIYFFKFAHEVASFVCWAFSKVLNDWSLGKLFNFVFLESNCYFDFREKNNYFPWDHRVPHVHNSPLEARLSIKLLKCT